MTDERSTKNDHLHTTIAPSRQFLVLSSPTDPRLNSHAHPPPQHHDRYQFVNRPPPSTSSDATHLPYFLSFVDSSNSLAQAMHPQGWPTPQSSVYSQASASNRTYFHLIFQQYPATPQSQPRAQHPTQLAEQLEVPGLAVTPASDSRVSPAPAPARPIPHSNRPRTF